MYITRQAIKATKRTMMTKKLAKIKITTVKLKGPVELFTGG
jgi:hypothetical protein